MQDCVLITGGAGFIGCEIAQGLPRTGLPIIAVDNLHPQVHPSGERPAVLPADVDLVVGDVRDAAMWQTLFTSYRPQTIFHLAAETGTGQSLTESSRHAGTNVTGTTEMLDAMTLKGLRPDHIVLSSSRAVYGEGAWRAADGIVFYPGHRTRAQLERAAWSFAGPDGQTAAPLPHAAATVEPHPTSVYGATKLAQEHILSAWTDAMGSALSILRFQNVYGPGQSPFNSYTGIITLFHRQARAGKTIEVYEDGDIGRDFVFISDVVRACLAASARRPAGGQRKLDIGTGVVTTIMDAARTIAAYHGAPEPAVCGKFRDGDIRWAVSDIAAWEREFGGQSFTSFADGSRAVAEWLIENKFI
jgi:dTDP-L-rhamnose 4-epimerase